MIVPDTNLLTMAAPLFLSAGLVPLILRGDDMVAQQNLHPLDAIDPAGWNRAKEWLPGAPIEKEYRLSPASACFVAEHASGRWRTLRRYGSVQSVTLMNPSSSGDDGNNAAVPVHSSAGNEYLKVMASAYAAFGIPAEHQQQQHKSSSPSLLHLGLGGGTLPMLLGEPCRAIELDADAVDLAIEYCGLDENLVSVVRGGDALGHRALAPGPHSCVFVDVFGSDNNVPLPFVGEGFVKSLWDSLLDDGGLVIANFHCDGTKQEGIRLQRGTNAYSRVFGSCLAIRSRYQGNTILCARKRKDGDSATPLSPPDDADIEKARRYARTKGWMFDPGARLEKAENGVPLPFY